MTGGGVLAGHARAGRRLALAAAFALAACGGDDGGGGGSADGSGGGAAGGAPAVTLLSPPDGSLLPAGAVTLSALVSDDRDAPASLTLTVTSDRDGVVATPVADAGGLVAAPLPGLTPGRHRLELSARDSDGRTGYDEVSLTVNAPPGSPVIAIDPDAPTTLDDLEVRVLIAAKDPDRGGDTLTTRVAWLRDGLDSGLSSTVVPAALTARGQTWTARVWSTDGLVDGPAAEDSVVIANSPPLCAAAQLLPSAATAADPLTCACTDREDADGDAPDGDACTFRVDGAPVDAEGCTLAPGLAAKGQLVTCTFTPHDGTSAGQPATSASVPILNAAPAAPSPSLVPAAGGVTTLFTCTVDAPGADPDGDDVTWEVTWVVNGHASPPSSSVAAVAGSLARDPAGTPARKGDAVTCRARAWDGASFSAPGQSQTVVLANSAPTGGSALVKPPAATEETPLTCEPSGALDPDGDPVSWLYGWLVDDVPVEGAGGATLTGAAFDKGQVVTCQVTPTDGVAAGAPVLAKNTVTIGNALPSLAGAQVVPATVGQDGTLTCTWSGWQDPDPGDAPEVDVAWQALAPGGAWEDVAEASGDTLAAAGLAEGTQVRCVATPRNGGEAGLPVTSAPAVVGNTLPSVGAVAIEPAEGGPCAPWTCKASGVVDPDAGDTVLLAWRWTLNGLPTPVTTAAWTGAKPAPGDTLVCLARPTDGATGLDGKLLYGAEVASPEVVVGNAAPSVAGASLSPEVVSPADTLTCVPGAASDPDACQPAPALAFAWIVDGVVVDGAETPTLGLAAVPVGAQVACRVTPSDGWSTGAAALSPPLTVGPDVPVVSLEAPGGADAAVACVLVQEPATEEPLDWTFLWSFNGEPEIPLPAELPAASVQPCDLLACRAVAEAGGGEISSNVDTLQLPYGPPCDDGDPCTLDGCASAGGCAHTAWSGPCDDGEPCTVGETCIEGACQGGSEASCNDANACTADACVFSKGCVHTPVAGPCGPGGAGLCVDGACCVPSCAGKACGGDGCGGSCGDCDGSAVCDEAVGQCVEPEPGMVALPATGFWMGCNTKTYAACAGAEQPQHPVLLDSYQIDETEVTVEAYAACAKDLTCKPAGVGGACNDKAAGREQHPVNCLAWQDAATYCAWAGKRLCTEAEWELAAIGDDGRLYPWGDGTPTCSLAHGDLGGLGDGCGALLTAPVGSYAAGASPWGVLDLAGNVEEWVQDWFLASYYLTSPKDNPTGPADGNFRTVRGGSYSGLPEQLRGTWRGAVMPNESSPARGFRCCKDFP